MKRTMHCAGLLALVSGFAGPSARAGTSMPLPTPFPEARYRPMSAKSPFAIASAASAPAAAPTPGFAAQLYVDGVAHVGESDFVAIKSRDPDNPATVFVEVGQSTKDGIKVEAVNWSGQMGKSTVDVSKGGEKATLEFDEAQISQNAAAAAATAMPPAVQEQGRLRVRLPRVSPDFVMKDGELVRIPPPPPGEMPGRPDGPQMRRRVQFPRAQ